MKQDDTDAQSHTLKAVSQHIEPLRNRLYSAAGMAYCARLALQASPHCDAEEPLAARCLLEELESLLAAVNDGLDHVNIEKAVQS